MSERQPTLDGPTLTRAARAVLDAKLISTKRWAHLSKLSRQAIIAIQQGKTKQPGLETANQLAQALGKDLAALLSLGDQKISPIVSSGETLLQQLADDDVLNAQLVVQLLRQNNELQRENNRLLQQIAGKLYATVADERPLSRAAREAPHDDAPLNSPAASRRGPR